MYSTKQATKTIFLWCAAVSIIILSVSGCASNKDPIVGKWSFWSSGVYNDDCFPQLEFFDDGTVKAGGLTGTYLLLANNKITIKIGSGAVGGFVQGRAYDYTINDNALIFSGNQFYCEYRSQTSTNESTEAPVILAPLATSTPNFTPTPSYSSEQISLLDSIHAEGKIMFVDNNKFYSMNPDGSDLLELTDYLGSDIGWDFDCSPDGTKIVTAKDTAGLTITDMNITKIADLTTNDRAYNPSWSPDGNKIVFVSGRDFGGQVFVINPDGTGLTELTTPDTGYELPAWTPDARIMFRSQTDHDKYYIMNSDGSQLSDITEEMYNDFSREWSPNKTAYLVNLYPSGDIEIFSADGSASVIIRASRYSPRWCP